MMSAGGSDSKAKALGQKLRELEAAAHDEHSGRRPRRSPFAKARISRDKLIRESFDRAFSPIEAKL